jgi:hypothetical protein
MSAFIRYLSALAELPPLLFNLATWLVTSLVARALNMPVPLVQAAGLCVLLKVQAFENRIGKSLCPSRLWRRIAASLKA